MHGDWSDELGADDERLGAAVAEGVLELAVGEAVTNRATPEAAYAARPRATPGTEPADRTLARIRNNRVDKVGKVTLRHGGQLSMRSPAPGPEPGSP